MITDFYQKNNFAGIEKHACFEFGFLINGQSINDINVTIEEQPGSEIARWSNPRYQNSTWNRGFISFPMKASKVNNLDFS